MLPSMLSIFRNYANEYTLLMPHLVLQSLWYNIHHNAHKSLQRNKNRILVSGELEWEKMSCIDAETDCRLPRDLESYKTTLHLNNMAPSSWKSQSSLSLSSSRELVMQFVIKMSLSRTTPANNLGDYVSQSFWTMIRILSIMHNLSNKL